jgi:uncharacterized membrane protein YqjE
VTATPATPAPTTPNGGSAPRHAAEPSVGQLVSEVSTQISTILHGEIELAKLELRSSVKNAGTGVGFFGAALVLLVFSLTFGLIALAEGFVALGVWRWAAYLIVFVLLIALVGALAFGGVKKVKAVRAPEKTIATGRDTVEYLRSHSRTSGER